ncbi:MAG: CheR family methyltransferase [Thermoplasmata archaeon]
MDLTEDQFLAQVKRHLLRSRGVDLTGYSPSFVMRCIRKRIGRTGAADYPAYLKLLTHGEEELNLLISALSINVTEFFRDKGAFEAFTTKVLRPLIAEKVQTGGMLRVWSAGCASGQESYTIAICVAEEFKRLGSDRRPMTSVVGTDLSASALARAKEGVYTQEEVKGVPERVLNQYFVRVDNRYAVAPFIRKGVRFARENLLEKPNSRFFDAIVCRNVLIYFSRAMHDVVTMNLWEALKPEGYLMLGRTETLLGAPRAYFEVIDQENRILRKRR